MPKSDFQILLLLMMSKKLGGNNLTFYLIFFLFINILFFPIRLHREALKQSATDPLSGRIDVGILTTGVSSATRKRRVELVKALKKLIESKGNVPIINYQKLLQELKDASSIVCY